MLLKKIRQYKVLFPIELKKFKLKKSPSVEDLNQAIDEIQAILDSNTVDTFLTDSLINSIKIIEVATAKFENYNLSGLSDALKSNPQFKSLCTQLYLKCNTFSVIPTEYQLIFIISTTAYICKIKNVIYRKENYISRFIRKSS
jgi:hypothetical protein